MRPTVKKVLLIVAGIIIIAITALSYGVYQAMYHWYSAYTGPNITEGRIDFPTLKDLKKDNEVLIKHPDFQQWSEKINKKMEDYQALLKTLENIPEDIEIDFIAMLHVPRTVDELENDPELKTAVAESQAKVKMILETEQHDIVGKENAWSEQLNPDTLLEENMTTLKELGIAEQDEAKAKSMIKSELAKTNKLDGAMQYQEENQKALVMGIEDKEIYQLATTVRSKMEETDNPRSKAILNQIDRTLVWLRTEIAAAKMVKKLKEQGRKKGVIVMGQSHRYTFEVLSKKIGLKSKQFHTVPENMRSDEAY